MRSPCGHKLGAEIIVGEKTLCPICAYLGLKKEKMKIDCTCEKVLERNVLLTNLLILSYQFLKEARFLFQFDCDKAEKLVKDIEKVEFWGDYKMRKYESEEKGRP